MLHFVVVQCVLTGQWCFQIANLANSWFDPHTSLCGCAVSYDWFWVASGPSLEIPEVILSLSTFVPIRCYMGRLDMVSHGDGPKYRCRWVSVEMFGIGIGVFQPIPCLYLLYFFSLKI